MSSAFIIFVKVSVPPLCIVSCMVVFQRYDGGISQGPLLESHGGSTFCAVATLSLMGELDSTFTEEQV